LWNWTGERTLEEKKDLENEIITAEKEFGVVSESNKELIESLKNLDDDIRSIKKKVKKMTINVHILNHDYFWFFVKKLAAVDSENEKYSSLIEELILENDMTY